MALIPVKVKVFVPPERSEEDKALDQEFARLNISRADNPPSGFTMEAGKSHINSKVIQNALGITRWKDEVYVMFVGGWMLVVLYEKASYDQLLHYMGQ